MEACLRKQRKGHQRRVVSTGDLGDSLLTIITQDTSTEMDSSTQLHPVKTLRKFAGISTASSTLSQTAQSAGSSRGTISPSSRPSSSVLTLIISLLSSFLMCAFVRLSSEYPLSIDSLQRWLRDNRFQRIQECLRFYLRRRCPSFQLRLVCTPTPTQLGSSTMTHRLHIVIG